MSIAHLEQKLDINVLRIDAKIESSGARLEQKMDARFSLLQWMPTFMLAAQMALPWKLMR